MNDEYLTPDEMAARRRETQVLMALRRMRHADPFAGLSSALKTWRPIPTDEIAAAVDVALSSARGGSLTLADVPRAWRKLMRRRARRPSLAVRMREASRALARRNAAVTATAAPVDPHEWREFCRQMAARYPHP